MSQVPPQFAGYPRLNNRPRIRFEAIGEAWAFFRADMGTWVLATFLTIFAVAVFVVPFYVLMLASALGKQKPDFSDIAVFYGYGFIMTLVVQVVQSIGLAGMHNLARKQVAGEEISIRDFFAVGKILPSVIAAGFLVGLATFVGFLLCYLPGMLAQGLFMFTFPILVRRGRGPIAAMSGSWDMLKDDMWMALAFSFVVALLSGLGAIACWIGIVFTFPLLPLSYAIVYRDFTSVPYDPEAPVAPYDV